MDNVQYYLGQEAVRLQLEKDRAELAGLQETHSGLTSREAEISRIIDLLENAGINTPVQFEALTVLPQLKAKLSDCRARLEEQKNSIAFTALKDQLDIAKKEYDAANEKENRLFSDKEKCENKIADLPNSSCI